MDVFNKTIPSIFAHDWATVLTINSCTSRPDVRHCLVVQTPMDNMSKNMPSTPMAHVACRSKLCLVVRSSMPPCLKNWVAIRRAVVYYARAAHAFSAGIECRHCASGEHSHRDPLLRRIKVALANL